MRVIVRAIHPDILEELTVTAQIKPYAWLIAITSLLGVHALGQEPMELLTADPEAYETAYGPTPQAVPPHLVLEPPKPRRHMRSVAFAGEVDTEPGRDPSSGKSAQAGILPHEKVAEHLLHADKTPRPVAIPGATRVPVWKTPYSYGHFGASRNRQWSLHHGYQNAYTQWTLR